MFHSGCLSRIEIINAVDFRISNVGDSSSADTFPIQVVIKSVHLHEVFNSERRFQTTDER